MKSIIFSPPCCHFFIASGGCGCAVRDAGAVELLCEKTPDP